MPTIAFSRWVCVPTGSRLRIFQEYSKQEYSGAQTVEGPVGLEVTSRHILRRIEGAGSACLPLLARVVQQQRLSRRPGLLALSPSNAPPVAAAPGAESVLGSITLGGRERVMIPPGAVVSEATRDDDLHPRLGSVRLRGSR
jgi:hypothetical protein